MCKVKIAYLNIEDSGQAPYRKGEISNISAIVNRLQRNFAWIYRLWQQTIREVNICIFQKFIGNWKFPISPQFCVNMQIVAINRVECWNLHISLIQYGERPPYWNSKIRNISTTIQPIVTNFCTDTQIVAINRVKSGHLHILKMADCCIGNQKFATSMKNFYCTV